jgi:hypothetical protein
MGSRSQDPNGHNGPGPTILDRSRESTKAACVGRRNAGKPTILEKMTCNEVGAKLEKFAIQ